MSSANVIKATQIIIISILSCVIIFCNLRTECSAYRISAIFVLLYVLVACMLAKEVLFISVFVCVCVRASICIEIEKLWY